ncbi:MAG: class I SAM-dependent methyltransferase [Acidimicrobiales bacterium]
MPELDEQSPTQAEILRRRWYHTIELPGGVVTPGEYDLRSSLPRLPLPADLSGKRCLDVGTHDGFWAFEMEKRGASEVVAIDLQSVEQLDWPEPRPVLDDAARAQLNARAEAFYLAHRALGSKVDRRLVSVYDLDVALVGRFDFAVIGTLLLHLRDPAGALMAIGRVLDGSLLVNDVISPTLTALKPRTPAAELLDVEGAPFWWLVNRAGLHRLVSAAGFRVTASGGPYLVANGKGFAPEPLSFRTRYGSGLPRQLLLRLGAPHAWVLAESVSARQPR